MKNTRWLLVALVPVICFLVLMPAGQATRSDKKTPPSAAETISPYETIYAAPELKPASATANSNTIVVSPNLKLEPVIAAVCTITCPANITVSNDPNQCGSVVNYPAPTTTGTCGTITCSPASGSFFPRGTTTVTCTASADPSSCTFTITVNDTQPPTITCPANITKSNDPNQCGAVVTYPAPPTGDNCPGVSTVCSPASGSFFPKGTTTVTCTSTDTSFNTATCSFTVRINDTQAPSITCPANQTAVGAPGLGQAAVNYPPPTASDNCPGVTAACVPASGSTFQPGSTPVTCTATDASNNTASCSFNVFVSCTPDASVSNPNPLVISRFRENGPGGATDEYVEIHNPTSQPHVVASGNCTGGYSVFASAGNGTTSNAALQVCSIPNGTVIPAGGYLLCTGSGYSLNNLGQNSGAAGATSTGDLPIGCGGTCTNNIPNDAGLALLDVGEDIVTLCTKGSFGCPTGFNFSSAAATGNARVFDSVGFSPYGAGAPISGYPSLAPNFCEGPCLLPVGDMSTAAACTNPTGLFPTVAAPPACYGQAGQYQLLRRQTGFIAGVGTPHQDTNNNPDDFILVAPNAASNMGLSLTGVSGVTSVHGVASPKNKTAPADRPLNQAPFDGPGSNQLGPRNADRVYGLDPMIANFNNDLLGTFVLRLRYTNGATPIAGLRFSIDNLSTLCGAQNASPVVGTAGARNLASPPDCGTGVFTAILKVVNSTQETVFDVNNVPQTVQGTVMQDLSAAPAPTPPGSGALAPLGGGIDSMLVLNNSTAPASVGDGVTGGTGVFSFPIPASQIVRVRFKFGVVRSGRFILLVQPMPSP